MSGDALIILPFVGIVAGIAVVQGLGERSRPVQTLPIERDVVTRQERSRPTSRETEGTLVLSDGTVVAQLVGGRARLKVPATDKAWMDDLWLDGHKVDWSMRASSSRSSIPVTQRFKHSSIWAPAARLRSRRSLRNAKS